MTEEEARIADWINNGHCPVCRRRGFVLGPMSGIAINVECAYTACGQRYNVAMGHGRVIRAELIDRVDGVAHQGTFS